MTEELETEQAEQYDVFRNYQEQVLPKSLHTLFFRSWEKKNQTKTHIYFPLLNLPLPQSSRLPIYHQSFREQIKKMNRSFSLHGIESGS